ncbi:MAG: GerMN domain-containing protein [Acidimicrobiales bacterium]
MRRPRSVRLLLLAVLLGVGALLAGCSVGAQGSAQLIAPKDVPFGLLKATPNTAVPTTGTILVTVFFEAADHLATVNRAVPAPGTLRAILKALGRGPSSAEAASLVSPISTATPLSLKSVSGGTAVVDVGKSFSALSGKDQIIAAAQLVYTLTTFPGIVRVAIRVGGQEVQMPTVTGRLRSGPLDRADYASLGPL